MTEAEEKYAVKIADRVMELSGLDTIKFDFVASIILVEFTNMTTNEVREWMYKTVWFYFNKRKEEHRKVETK